MTEPEVTLKLINKDLFEIIKDYYVKYKQMKEVGYFYLNDLLDKNHNNVKAIYTTNYTEGTDELVGFQKESNAMDVKFFEEMFDQNLNTFKRGKDYQPLRKNRFNQNITDNFTKTIVSYKPVLEVIFGTPDTMVFVEGTSIEPAHFRVKSMRSTFNEDSFVVTIQKRDVTQHTLDNFEVIE